MAFKKRFVPKRKPMTKKRVYRKRKNVITALSASAYPFPRTTTRKLKYTETIFMNPGVATMSTYVFACNGLYDPNITGTGHQPYGFDQLMLLYNHYEVLSSRIRISSSDSGVTNPLVVVSRVDADGAFNSTSVMEIIEQPDVKRKFFNSSNMVKMSLSNTWTQKKFFGSRKAGDDGLCGTGATNPAELSYFVTGLGCLDSLSDPGGMYVTFELEYVARFFEPKELSAS